MDCITLTLVVLARTALVACFLLAAPAAAMAQPSVSPAGVPVQSVPATGVTLDQAMAQALARNPALAAARLRRAVAEASRSVAAERLNPEAHVEIERETPKRSFGIAVPWETGGKRARRIEVGDLTIAAADAELTQHIAEVRAEVRRAYFAALIADTRVNVLTDLRSLAQRASEAAQTRFDAGSAPRLEVMQAQLAVADTENQLTGAAGEAEAARATLAALIGQPNGQAITFATPVDAIPDLSREAVVARAEGSSAELLLLDRRLAEQRARVALARALQQPDLTPEATITQGNEPEFDIGWRAALSVTVPIFTRHRAGVLVEQTTLSQLQAERDAAAARIAGDVAAAYALVSAQRQQYERYRDDILPQAAEIERMADDAYRLGQTGIAAYLQALQSTRDVRMRSLQAAADLHNALADLERAAGTSLP
jgi:cobalt-zinc-cadmium efflux system outer membrane protein